MIDFAALLYGRSFATFGVPATLTLAPISDEADPVVVSITGIDRTAGVEVTDQAVGIQTVRPAVDVRRIDLDAAGVSLAALDGAALQINGTTWEVSSIMEKPTPFGPSDGLVTLLLVGNA